MKTACYNILIKEMEVMSMKNKKMKSGGLLTLAFLMAAGNVMPALAGSWQQDAAGWRWKNDDGSYHAGSWQWLDGNRDGVSECYYFAPNGYMLANTVTPDGFQSMESGCGRIRLPLFLWKGNSGQAHSYRCLRHRQSRLI